VAELLFLITCQGSVVKLHRANRCGDALHLEQKNRVANCDLVAWTQKPLLDGNAVDVGTGSGFQIREQEALILSRYLAVQGRDGRIVDTDQVGGASSDRQRRGEAEFGLSEGTTER